MPGPHELPPHERWHHNEKKPHEQILDRLDRIEETLSRIEEKLG